MEIGCVIDRRLANPARPRVPAELRSPLHAFADPVAAGEVIDATARALEEIGAAVETTRSGAVFFMLGGLRPLYGGEVAGVVAAARRSIESPVLIGVAPTPTGARAAAELGELVVTASQAARFLASLPTSVLTDRLDDPRRARELIGALERLGVTTLGELRQLGPDHVADRFGDLGLRALRIARGEEEKMCPRVPHEILKADLDLEGGVAGAQLDNALRLLIDRLLAAPARKGRTLLGVGLGAQLGGGRSWSVEQGFGEPTAEAAKLRRLLAPRLEKLPGPPEALHLWALGFGPPAADQLVIEVGDSEPRRRRVDAVAREIRATQGADALLRVVTVDPASRIPERRYRMTPFRET